MRQFHELFAGRDDVYGTYALSKAQKSTEKGDKRLGKAKTISDTKVTKEHYDKHLAGEQSIGIVPIRLDGTVSWFAIDVDDYATNNLHARLATKIEKLNLPLLVFETKSGGAHLYCFLTKPIEAITARDYAEKFVKALGLPTKTEIFPKQNAIKRNDGGSWINLPYFGDTRRCLGVDGMTPLSVKEFLLLAAEKEVLLDDLEQSKSEIKHREDEPSDGSHSGAPPCVIRMLADGIEEGGRDNALTHLAVYLKRAFPDDWQEQLNEINETIVTPPMPVREIMRIIKSAERKDYQYLCKQTPMVAICDKAACLKQKFGIGQGETVTANFNIDALRKIGNEDPYYVIVVDGLPVKLTSLQLMDFKQFKRAVFEKHNKIIGHLKPADWEDLLSDALENIQIEEAPEEVGTTGMIRRAFMDWTAQRLIGGGVRERVVDGQPYYDEKKKVIVFRGTDFISHCRRNLGNQIDNRVVWLTLEEQGAEETRMEVSGKKLRVWKFPVGEPWFEIHSQDGAF